MTDDIEVSITKTVTHVFAEPRPFTMQSTGGPRLVFDAKVRWEWWDGEWVIRRITYMASEPKRDGTPSARVNPTTLWLNEFRQFTAAIPETGIPPVERITITIEGAA